MEILIILNVTPRTNFHNPCLTPGLVSGSHFVTQIWFRYSAWYFVKSAPRPVTEIAGSDITDRTTNYPQYT